jgi:hypothetical protein
VLADKGAVVEEWIDLHFFRPLGVRVARRLLPTRVSADQVTLACTVLGLVAGHLFFYDSRALNVLGLALFVLSDVLDSADGQLARLRGASTRFGRMLDGLSDNLRFINLYLNLMARLIVAGWPGADAFALALAAGVSHSLQSAAVDFARQAWLFFVTGGGELDLPETAPAPSGPWYRRLVQRIYRDYVKRQALLLPRTAALVREQLGRAVPSAMGRAYATLQERLVRRCAFVGQNVRFLLLAVTACVGWPAGFFWLTVGPLNLILVALLVAHERHAAALRRLPPAPELAGAHAA